MFRPPDALPLSPNLGPAPPPPSQLVGAQGSQLARVEAHVNGVNYGLAAGASRRDAQRQAELDADVKARRGLATRWGPGRLGAWGPGAHGLVCGVGRTLAGPVWWACVSGDVVRVSV
jgi:hypothetical protein